MLDQLSSDPTTILHVVRFATRPASPFAAAQTAGAHSMRVQTGTVLAATARSATALFEECQFKPAHSAIAQSAARYTAARLGAHQLARVEIHSWMMRLSICRACYRKMSGGMTLQVAASKTSDLFSQRRHWRHCQGHPQTVREPIAQERLLPP